MSSTGTRPTRQDAGIDEEIRDGSALEAHRNSAHYRELVVERILPLLTDRRVEFLRPESAP